MSTHLAKTENAVQSETEKRMFALVREYLEAKGFTRAAQALVEEQGTYTARMSFSLVLFFESWNCCLFLIYGVF
jgi:hypothetical protein